MMHIVEILIALYIGAFVGFALALFFVSGANADADAEIARLRNKLRGVGMTQEKTGDRCPVRSQKP